MPLLEECTGKLLAVTHGAVTPDLVETAVAQFHTHNNKLPKVQFKNELANFAAKMFKPSYDYLGFTLCGNTLADCFREALFNDGEDECLMAI